MGYLLLAAVASVGFLASLVCHVMAWLHCDPPWGKSVVVLHIGFLILWFPLVLFSNKTMPKGAKGNAEHLLAEVPRVVRGMVTALAVYAFLNFAFFMYSSSGYAKGQVPFYIELRGFSGHWMLFYGVATVGFIGLARFARKRQGEILKN